MVSAQRSSAMTKEKNEYEGDGITGIWRSALIAIDPVGTVNIPMNTSDDTTLLKSYFLCVRQIILWAKQGTLPIRLHLTIGKQIT